MNLPKRRTFIKTALGATFANTMTKLSMAKSASKSEDANIVAVGAEDEALRMTNRHARATDPRPNILLLFTDQQTINAMSCTGNRWVNTPHMDEIARSGIRFLDSYCASPICGPSRGSMVTGLPPHMSGVIYNGDPLPKDIPTIGSVLRESGYYTAWTGKWHLPASFIREATDEWGFHHRALSKDVPMVALGDQTDFITATDAEFFLRWQVGKQPKPWFLGVSLHNPHDICYHVMENGGEYPNKDTFPPLPRNFEEDPNEPKAVKMRRENRHYGHEVAMTKDWNDDRWRVYLHTYYHLVTQVDRAVGQILRALDAGGWKENTIVIFTSDHGEGMAAHRWATKLSLYEESAKVPLIISIPGKGTRRGLVGDVLASGLDLFPTICDYAGAKAPVTPGKSLRPAIEGKIDNSEHYVVCELAADKARPEIQGRMVRTKQFKYCAYSPGRPSEQLFNLIEDPGETRNLISDSASTETLQKHRKYLAAWCRKTGDSFVFEGNT